MLGNTQQERFIGINLLQEDLTMNFDMFKKYIDICYELGVKPTLEGAAKFKMAFK